MGQIERGDSRPPLCAGSPAPEAQPGTRVSVPGVTRYVSWKTVGDSISDGGGMLMVGSARADDGWLRRWAKGSPEPDQESRRMARGQKGSAELRGKWKEHHTMGKGSGMLACEECRQMLQWAMENEGQAARALREMASVVVDLGSAVADGNGDTRG
ncbi:hypothetical protein ColTof4_06960 [Colletotrichum tofieldiae]|nr:hypothetical protein ColTof3_11906 [Colletotrichum tofieldiae]GKT74537.1 hypothetical protein ColTof4_06960 [Colletotrichum tofieldiae]GKT91720.1 hypothetical protein Ct61P_09570 [Colletotrichum tofieldiae]